jgi:hypothetical protein
MAVQSPAAHVFLITPSDDANLANPTRGISFHTAGALKVTTAGGEIVVIPDGALAAGIVHPLEVVKVFDTGTDADGLVGYY